jgi:hypothetical protein
MDLEHVHVLQHVTSKGYTCSAVLLLAELLHTALVATASTQQGPSATRRHRMEANAGPLCLETHLAEAERDEEQSCRGREMAGRDIRTGVTQ